MTMTAGMLSDCNSWEEASKKAPPGTSIRGWIYADEGELYFQLAKKMVPGMTFVEIGVYGGANEVLIGLTASKDVTIIGIDDFSNDTHEKGQRSNGVPESEIELLETICRRNVHLAGLTGDVQILKGSSHEIGRYWDSDIDWLIIDGDHSFDGCMADLKDFAPWVKVAPAGAAADSPSGLLVIDDYSDWDTVGEAVRAWLAAEPAGRWEKVWEFKPPQGSTIAFRRVAG